MSGLDEIVGKFESVSLEAMDYVKLLNRIDTKFTFRMEQLQGIFDEIVPHYRVLEVGGIRAHRYETLYFDTRNLVLYSTHHSGKFARHKIRYRKYLDSHLCFFELKTKTNQGRTLKRRIRDTHIREVIEGEAESLIRTEIPFCASDFRPSLQVSFTRLTFVGKFAPERLTIDVDLSFRAGEKSLELPRLVIAEVKRDRASSESVFIEATRRRRIWEGSMSKYCFGVANLYPLAKRNLFKERIRQIHELAA